MLEIHQGWGHVGNTLSQTFTNILLKTIYTEDVIDILPIYHQHNFLYPIQIGSKKCCG